jgi:aminoglycoside phosphotransferase (APT) family kinase protein
MFEADLDALGAWLAARSGATGATITGARRLSGGAVQENWLLPVDFSGGPMDGAIELVLRTDAPSGVSDSHTRLEEFRLLQVAHAAGVTVPEPLFAEPEGTLLGKPFFVMRRLRGTAEPRKLTRDLGLDPHRPALVERLGRELARLHRIRPPDAQLDFLAPPAASAVAARLDAFRGQLDALPHAVPILEWGIRWLELNTPPPGVVVLCHGDYRTGNYMVDGAQLSGILDWEFSCWSDPLDDIGWLCARCWRFGADERPVGGVGERADLYRGYAAEAGQPLDWSLVPYWEVMATVRWAVIAHHQGQRHVSGREFNLELALTGRKAAEMELDVLTQVRRIEDGRSGENA